ncbi:MAG TPA: YajG family lipoprotein [Burkholderiales bacterium]|nr:YajG family lipoprotein [Burkholderiales bacterium]
MNKRLYFLPVFLAGCATTGLENIPLLWMPTTGMFAMGPSQMAGLEDARLQVDPVVDKRENAALIGQNREDQTPRQVTTSDDVPAFVTNRMKALMSAAGMKVVDSGGSAILKTELRQFFVDETDTYQAEVILRVTLTDPDGNVLWSGLTSGAAARYGRSYKAENYYETLSDSLVGAVQQLIQNRGFRTALAGS